MELRERAERHYLCALVCWTERGKGEVERTEETHLYAPSLLPPSSLPPLSVSPSLSDHRHVGKREINSSVEGDPAESGK